MKHKECRKFGSSPRFLGNSFAGLFPTWQTSLFYEGYSFDKAETDRSWTCSAMVVETHANRLLTYMESASLRMFLIRKGPEAVLFVSLAWMLTQFGCSPTISGSVSRSREIDAASPPGEPSIETGPTRASTTSTAGEHDISAIERNLQRRIAKVLNDNLSRRLLSARTNAAWQIMHGVVAYGDHLPLDIEGKRGNTLGFLAWRWSRGRLGISPWRPFALFWEIGA